MRHVRKLVVTALLAGLTLALATGTANATRLEVGSPGTITNTGVLTFRASFGNVVCPVTKLLTLHRTIAKVERTLAGYVRQITISPRCNTNDAEILEEGGLQTRDARVRWHITYESFSGTLPNITSIRLLINPVAFLISAPFTICLYGGNALATTVGNPVRQIRVDERWPIPLVEQIEGFCPREGFLVGALTISPTVTIRLI